MPKTTLVRAQLLLLMLVTYASADGTLFLRQDNPGVSCKMTMLLNGGMLAWQCPANATPMYFKYYSTSKMENGYDMYMYVSQLYTLAFSERYDQVSVIPIQDGVAPQLLFLRADLMVPSTPPQWGYCDPMDRDIITGRCP